MGSSFIKYRGKFWSRDAFIEDLLGELASAAANTSGEPWLSEAAAHWRLQASRVFNGCVSPDLDDIVVDDARRDVVLGLLEALHPRWASDHARATTALLVRLLRGELATDTASPLDYMVGRVHPS